jgi:hypothetical protein
MTTDARPFVWRVIVSSSIAVMSLTSSVGCLAHGATAGRDADASIAGARMTLHDFNAALADIETRLEAGRDILHNDNWTVRLLGLGVLLLGLSYPVGKIVWIAAVAVSRRAVPGRLPNQSGSDFIAFRQLRASSCDAMRPA